jgi:hypothetical protein
MAYEHTQSRPQLAMILLVGTVVTLGLALVIGDAALFVTPAVFALVTVVGFALSAMTTAVGPDRIVVAFRWGFPRREIHLRAVGGVAVVRNRWWHGLGIRWVPGGTMYNVWGLDAVHLRIEGGRDFRIGTDDPHGLAEAVEQAVRSDRP